MRENYPEALRLVLTHEGGFVDHPKDPGGATNKGITQAVYSAYRRSIGSSELSVRYIKDEEMQAIYRLQYADRIMFDELPIGVDYAVFDFAVNSGVARAVKYLQRVVGADTDGIMGRKTLAAVLDYHDHIELVKLLCEGRRMFVRRLKTYSTFGRGWERRIDAVDVTARAMIRGRPTMPHAYTEAPEKAQGGQTLLSTISESRRSKAATIGTAGAILGAVPEAIELSRPAKEAFSVGRYATLIGLIITVVALVYIIWVRAKRDH